MAISTYLPCDKACHTMESGRTHTVVCYGSNVVFYGIEAHISVQYLHNKMWEYRAVRS